MTGKEIIRHISDNDLFLMGATFSNGGFYSGISVIKHICKNDLFDVEVADVGIQAYTADYKFVTSRDVYAALGINHPDQSAYVWSVPKD